MCSASATVYLVSDSVGEGHFSLSNLLMPVGIPQRYTIPATSVKSVVKCLAPVPPQSPTKASDTHSLHQGSLLSAWVWWSGGVHF